MVLKATFRALRDLLSTMTRIARSLWPRCPGSKCIIRLPALSSSHQQISSDKPRTRIRTPPERRRKGELSLNVITRIEPCQ